MPERSVNGKEKKVMTNKELKKLTRLQLLELLVEQGKELERLRRRAERAEEKLRKRMLLLSDAGSIAEAALRLNGVFEAAQAAADQYLDSVRAMHGVAFVREEQEAGKGEGLEEEAPEGKRRDGYGREEYSGKGFAREDGLEGEEPGKDREEEQED